MTTKKLQRGRKALLRAGIGCGALYFLAVSLSNAIAFMFFGFGWRGALFGFLWGLLFGGGLFLLFMIAYWVLGSFESRSDGS